MPAEKVTSFKQVLDNANEVAAEAVAKAAVKEALAKPIFDTHSQNLAGVLIAQENSLRKVVADIDDRIAAAKEIARVALTVRDQAIVDLEAERRDAELASSGITAALAKIKE